jgi:hypothetical protein
MRKKLAVSLLALLMVLVGAVGAWAATKRTYTYRGKTSQTQPVMLKIGYSPAYKQTWVMYMSFGYEGCGGSYTSAVNGGAKVSKTHSFQYRKIDRRAGGYVEMRIIHGRVSGWDAKKKAWKKATGTWRVVYNQPTGTEEDPPRSCDDTFHWTATRRG